MTRPAGGRERMRRVDHAWLRMDSPHNWMIITGMVTLDRPVDATRFRAAVERSLLRFRRFRQRLVWGVLPGRRPEWEDDPDFDLDAHIERVSLPEPAGKAELEALAGELMRHGLEYDRPLWRFYLVENYNGGGAVLARLHHCLADGVALVRVLLQMTDFDAGGAQPADIALFGLPALPAEAQPPAHHEHTLLEEAAGILPAALRAVVRDSTRLTARYARLGWKALRHPPTLRRAARLGLDTAAAAGRLALRLPDRRSLLRGPLGEAKAAAWSQTLSLEEVKQVGRAYGATVNDVLLACVAGALRRYLAGRKQRVDDLSLRGFIPVNLRPLDEAEALGNRFGLVFLTLPVGVADPVKRLRALKLNMDGVKASQEAIASYGILGLMGGMPGWVQDLGISIFDAKGTAVMTNVPGPRQPLYLAGAGIQTLLAWVPQSGRVGLGVSLVSYNGGVCLGIAGDARLAPDPRTITEAFEDEFAGLRLRAETVMEKRSAAVRPMLAQLDEALKKLDDLLE